MSETIETQEKSRLKGRKMRVAALQFVTETDVSANLKTCMRMINSAASDDPDLMVMGEFSNHLSWYDDQDHAWDVALDIGGAFLNAIADKAAEHSCYIDINVTLRRVKPVITVTSLLFGPDGQLVAEADKQTLMGHENTFFDRATTTSPVVDTPYGKLGLFPCRDGVTFETPRGLALRGVQLFCDSLNSFALDEATLHVPARAPENKCFLISANKIGPLIPEALLEPVSEATMIPVKYLMGAGGSQIVAPSGQVLALASTDKEEVIFADIDLSDADDKTRPDGADILKIRRPELYADIIKDPEHYSIQPAQDQIAVSLIQPSGLDGLDRVVSDLPDAVKIAVLPALFAADSHKAEAIISKVKTACAHKDIMICTSVRFHDQHQTILVDKNGIVAAQGQLHASNRWGWSGLADSLEIIDLPWGRVAMLHSDDAAIPEIVKVAALQGIHCLLVPADFQEEWETKFGLPSRAAENRICIVACGQQGQGGMIATLERDFTILTEWKERAFDGKINDPLITHQKQDSAITTAIIHPNAASNKLMSENTDLLADRPWFLSRDLVAPQG